jgi:hypothetical protein
VGVGLAEAASQWWGGPASWFVDHTAFITFTLCILLCRLARPALVPPLSFAHSVFLFTLHFFKFWDEEVVVSPSPRAERKLPLMLHACGVTHTTDSAAQNSVTFTRCSGGLMSCLSEVHC